MINASFAYSQSSDKKYKKTRKIQVGSDKKTKNKKSRSGKKSSRKNKKGKLAQNKFSIDKHSSNRKKKTGTAYDDLLKDDVESSILYSQVMKADAKDAKLKRKVSKKVNKANKKLLKNYNYGREKGQTQQDRVYKKMRKAGKKTNRVQHGKNATPWIKRVFRKKRGRTASRKKE